VHNGETLVFHSANFTAEFCPKDAR